MPEKKSDQDADKRRDEVLKRMLKTPPQPRTKKDEPPAKPKRAGKPESTKKDGTRDG